MRRMMSVWLPDWPWQRFCRERPGAQRQLIVLWTHAGRAGERVVSCSRSAWRRGVRSGMALTEVLALGSPQLFEWNRAADQLELARLRLACEQFSPLVGWAHSATDSPSPQESTSNPPSTSSHEVVRRPRRRSSRTTVEPIPRPVGLLLDVTGVSARWGGEELLANAVQDYLRRESYVSQIAVAATGRAAWACARFTDCPLQIIESTRTREALGPLPVTALDLDRTTLELLNRLGIERLEQLAQLPRAGMATRFGSSLLERLDQAWGDQAEVLQIPEARREWRVSWTLDHPTVCHDQLEWMARHLSSHLAELLSQQQQGALQIVCRWEWEGSEGTQQRRLRKRQASEETQQRQGEKPREREETQIDLFRPVAAVSAWWEPLWSALVRQRWRGPLIRLELQATVTAPLPPRQRSLWIVDEWESQRGMESSEFGGLIDRLQHRLGSAAVCRVNERAALLPEEAYQVSRWSRLGEGTTHPKAARIAARGPRPARPIPHTSLKGARPADGLPSEASGDELPPPRPLQLLHPPCPLVPGEVDAQGRPLGVWELLQTPHRIEHVWGPERIETAWWRRAGVRRDYYRVACDHGYCFWLFRDLTNQEWFLHGCFS